MSSAPSTTVNPRSVPLIGFRRKIADALNVNELQVNWDCIHQHDAPLFDVNARDALDLVPSPPHLGDLLSSNRFRTALRLRAANALKRLEPRTDVGRGKAKLEKLSPRTGARRRRMGQLARDLVTAMIPAPDRGAGRPDHLLAANCYVIRWGAARRSSALLRLVIPKPSRQGHMNPDTPGLAENAWRKKRG